MHFLKMYEKTAIYNGTALLKTTNRMYIMMNKSVNMQIIYTMQCMETLTYIKMFVQTAKGKYKNVTMFLYCHQRDMKERKKQ